MKTITYDETKWRLVPVDEPTLGMGFAYLDAARAHMSEEDGSAQRFSWPGYRALIDAAPQAPADERGALSDVQRDSERYRWLRLYHVDSYLASGRQRHLDEEIDSAMAQERKAQEGE